jgi:hypothetical protein
MFGVVGMSQEVRHSMAALFGDAIGPVDLLCGPDAVIGGHAHGAFSAVVRSDDGGLCGDGEAPLYRRLAESAQARELYSVDGDGLSLTSDCCGNLALWEERTRELSIGTDWAGTFPLYFAEVPGKGFLFSSRVIPLAVVLQSEIDALGVTQFLRNAYYESDRCIWSGIRRAQPGQSLKYDGRRLKLVVAERSRLWSGQASRRLRRQELATDCWDRLGEAVSVRDDGASAYTIMSSGGWDSRTILACMLHTIAPERMLAYSHGDPASREVRIAQQIVGSGGVAFHQEPIDHRCYEAKAFHDGFRGEEHVMFPHWLRAGHIARIMGDRIVTSGVFGEVVGGHYGRGMVLRGKQQARAIAVSLLGSQAPAGDATVSDLLTLRKWFGVAAVERPWVIREDWWRAANVEKEQWDADVARDIARFQTRGVRTLDQFVEAYVAEHRGAQYINAQLRSARRYVNVTVPFADRRVLEWATSLPLSAKIHNRVNQAALARFRPDLLRFPMAATLADARRPLVVQEGSRFVRKGFEASRGAWQGMTGAPFVARRLSWVNFDFLRRGRELESLLDDLKGDLWDKAAIAAHIQRCKAGSRVSAHSTSDHLLKVYTLDLSLRGGRSSASAG